ncbi:MAG: hypothetical protein IT379_01345, partial [Deltaproteobacteria bacterium]|nr:hypothetical protein [Deltaproteobacteria bacterium]
MRRARWSYVVSWIALLAACGGDGLAEDVDATLATVERVRGSVRAGDRATTLGRITRGQKIATAADGLARLVLDSGPRLLVGSDARVVVGSPDTVALEAGRLYAEVVPGDRLTVSTGGASIATNDGSLSAELRGGGSLVVYVVRGDVAWVSGNHRGTAHAGEELTLGGGRATTAPSVLWTDWTGGLARPGPQGSSMPEGMGTLEARVPEELGLARWPLVIRRLDVRVTVHDDLAITEVDQEFFNPASDTVEGLYRVRVPDGAVLSQFAVDRDGRLVEGFVREKAQARAAYEAQVYRGSTDDPALLEWVAPGSYKAQIYPIPPGATRRIVIRYAEWLSRPGPNAPRLYRYPMGTGSTAPHVQELSLAVDLTHAGAASVRAGMGATIEENAVLLRRSDFRPRSDFWLELVDPGNAAGQRVRAFASPYARPRRAPGSRAITNEADEREFLLVPVVLPESLAARQERSGLDVVIVADVSSGTDRSHLELGRSVVESITTHLGADDRVAVVTSDVALRGLATERRPSLGPASRPRIEGLLEALARAPAGGATDLGAAIAEAAALLDPARSGIVVYVGDGAPTVGELEAAPLLERIARLPSPVRLYGVGVGGEANLDLLEALSAGGGLAARVEERSEAAEVSLRILAHASRPLASRVTFDLGSGVDGVYPRRAVDVVLGEPLVVLGRVRGAYPRAIVVRGIIAGRPFAQRFDVEVRKVPPASTDLRLRWANERLRHLLLEGAGREAVAELGTRYGLITPYTSYYVPSARELREMGESASWLRYRELHDDDEARMATNALAARSPSASLFAMFAFTACRGASEDAPSSVTAVAPPSPVAVAEPEAAEEAPAAMDDDRAAAGGGQPMAQTGQAAPTVPAAPSVPGAPPPALEARSQPMGAALAAPPPPPSPAPVATPTPAADPAPGFLDGPTGGGGSGGGLGASTLLPSRPTTATTTEIAQPMRRATASRRSGGAAAGGEGFGGDGLGGLDRPTSEGRRRLPADRGLELERGDFQRNREEPSSGEAERGRRPNETRSGGDFWADANEADERGGTAEATVDLSTRAQIGALGYGTGGRSSDVVVDHDGDDGEVVVRIERSRRARCSDASRLPLEDRRALWRERIGDGGVSSWVADYRRAGRECELPGWRDRRAFLDIVLDRAGSIGTMVDLYRRLSRTAAAGHLRAAILRRVRSPSDLRVARNAFGMGLEPDWPTVERLLREASDDAARIRILRQLSRDYPSNTQVRLRLLAALERARRLPEARRLADQLRADPAADAVIRTEIGEMFLRLGDRDEARRAFSEIVELAPMDALARRRLGDLYRAHGWHEDAYRQYRTLAFIR